MQKTLDPESCTVCAHIQDNGWTGLDRGSHCRECHAIFSGNMIHCVVCHKTFSTPRTLDVHKTGLQCNDPDSMTHNGKPLFGAPSPNAHGTPVYRLASDGGWLAERRQ